MRQESLTAEEQEARKSEYPAIFARRKETFAGFDFDFQQGPFMASSEQERNDNMQAIWDEGGLHFWIGNFFEVMVDEAANDEAYKFWRDKTRARINDPVLAEKLAPMQKPHPFGTKRLSLEQGYYEVFNQDNASLVDLKETPIEHISADGVQVAGEERKLDILILGTGFDAVTGGILKIDLRGVGGTKLGDRWADGLKTQLGMASAQFPNMFFLYGPQSPSGFSNGPGSIEVQVDWLTDCLEYMRSTNQERIEAEHDAEIAWSKHCAEIVNATLFPKANSWYMGANIPGKHREILNYPGGISMYLELCEASAAKGYSGFRLD